MSNPFDSPFIVPVAGCIMILGLGASGIYSEIRKREMQSRERALLIHRGVPLAEIEKLQSISERAEKSVRDPLRSLANARRTMLVLISSGVGVVLFGVVLFLLVQERETLIVSGIGLVDICVGVGFLVDYNMQKRELSRFGMELSSELNEPLN